MTQIDQLKKWLNEIGEHYKALETMKLHLLTYANEKYYAAQNKLVESIFNKGVFDSFHHLREHDLPQNFLHEYRHILCHDRGAGWCLWKPFVIAQTLQKIEQNDIISYMDSADAFNQDGIHNLREFLLRRMLNTDVLPTTGGFKNYQYTKRDVFVYMGCDTSEYHNAIQLEAGVLVIKRTANSIRFVNTWLDYCKDPRLITDRPNECGMDNLPGFIDVRYDQSILSLLCQKKEIQPSDDIRKFVTCNVNG